MALQVELLRLCDKQCDLSLTAVKYRKSIISMLVDYLGSCGFNVAVMTPNDLTQNHIENLITFWKNKKLNVDTIKPRISVLRWLSKAIRKPNIVKSNDFYGIGTRKNPINKNIAKELSEIDTSQMDEYLVFTLRLQACFGLRLEEAVKFEPSYALDNQSSFKLSFIIINRLWTIDNKLRTIPITNDEQVKLISDLLIFAEKNNGFITPPDKTKRQYLAYYENQMKILGVGKTKGLRYSYAQKRYKDLIGFDSPAIDDSKKLNSVERVNDGLVRDIISKEMGDMKFNSTNIYLGTWVERIGDCA